MMNYGRFYGLMRTLGCEGEKEALVLQFTGGRTCSLREMRVCEYKCMCDALSVSVGRVMEREMLREELRRKRSVVLRLMGKIGVDTGEWHRVDAFCLSERICGKEFRKLDVCDLDVLGRKLRAILKKGGLKGADVGGVNGGCAGGVVVVIGGGKGNGKGNLKKMN